jgi:predicted alpha/beta hydrolase
MTLPETTPGTVHAFTLPARDGYPLAATLFQAAGRPRGRIIVAGATGVPQRFYRRFAEHAQQAGFTVLTLDYRGIGQSRPASLRGFDMQYTDWGKLDLAAAVDAMADGPLPLYWVGHSYGGHALGMLPNHQRVTAAYALGVGAGWHGWMPWYESLRVRFMWATVLPWLTRWKGYSPWAMLGIGEDLPAGVFWQWRHWCRFPRYFFDDPASAWVHDAFASVRTPLVAATALDDLWAMPRSRDAFFDGYRQAPQQRRNLDPAQYGKLGHMGYFRAHAQPLWQEMLDWFDTQAPRSTAAQPA